MTSPTSRPTELLRPLPDLAAWTNHFRQAEIPVLRETVESLHALRANEDRTDANSIGELIGGDPLMTLKVLAHASDRRGRSVVTGAETVIAAIVMLGIPPFFRAFEAPATIEDRLGDRPEAEAGLERVLSRAHRGARFALAFAIHRTDPHAATVHAAALLHEFAEMLLWCHAPELALRIQSLQHADPSMRSSAAQRSVLNVELADLQQSLACAWRLPSLLVESGHAPQAAQLGARAVHLGARLARHTAAGWDNPALPDDVAEVAALLNLSPAAALRFVTEIDGD